MRLEDISLDELSEALAPGGVIDDDTGLWTMWVGDERAFGLPNFPFVCLQREQPWCEVRIYTSRSESWITAAVQNDGWAGGHFPENTSVGDALLACRTLMQCSVDGADSVFPLLVLDERADARPRSLFEKLFRYKHAIVALNGRS